MSTGILPPFRVVPQNPVEWERYFRSVQFALLDGVNVEDVVNPALTDEESAAGITSIDRAYPLRNIMRYGATGDGVTDDSAAEDRAHSAYNSIQYPPGAYAGTDNPLNLYATTYTEALYERIQSGTSTDPVADAEPVLWVQKFSSATRSTNPQEWDQGGVYSSLVKVEGSAYGAGLTGFVRHMAGTGQMIGVHGRARGDHEDSQTWGGWFYSHIPSSATSGVLQAIGVEINMNNDGPDQGWMADGGVGATRALLVTTADNSNPCTLGVSIQAGNRGQTTPADGFYTGLLIPRKSIRPASDLTTIGDNEAIRLQGSPIGLRHGGMRFHDDYFHYGISLAESSFTSNCAILLGQDQRIVVGDSPTRTTYLAFDRTNNVANFQNLNIQITGTKVVGTRRTGWTADTGTSKRTATATYSGTAEVGYTQATIQTLMDAVRDASQTIKALKEDLTTHGLIGT